MHACVKAFIQAISEGRGAYCRSAWDLMVPVRKPRPAAHQQNNVHFG